MDKKLYIANWKSHKTKNEAVDFLEKLSSSFSDIDLAGKEIIIAPSFTLLSECRYMVDKKVIPVKIAGQNVSPFPEGAYTGEVNARQLREFAEYVILGHSERRKYFHEGDSDIQNKVREALDVGLEIIQCVQDENDIIHKGVGIVAYEPPSAIGSGNPDDPKHVAYVFEKIQKDNPNVKVLYGGSVNADNIKDFADIKSLYGFLIGGASLDVDSFISLLNG